MATKQPTNSDLLERLESMNTTLQTAVKDVGELKTWRISQEAAKKAVDEYRRQESNDNRNTSVMSVLKQVGIILGILTAILYAWASTKGLHP